MGELERRVPAPTIWPSFKACTSMPGFDCVDPKVVGPVSGEVLPMPKIKITSTQGVVTEDQKNEFISNAWMKPCGIDNHESWCYTPTSKSYPCISPSGARLICGEGCKDCKEVVIPFPDGSALYKTVPDKSK